MLSKAKGFTLVELVVVMVLLVIVSVTAVPKFIDTKNDNVYHFAKLVVAKLRTIQEQNMSINDGACYFAIISPRILASSYSSDCKSVPKKTDWIKKIENNSFDDLQLKVNEKMLTDTNYLLVAFNYVGDLKYCFVGTEGISVRSSSTSCLIDINDSHSKVEINKSGFISLL